MCGNRRLGVAAKKIYENLEADTARMRELKTYLAAELEKMEQVEINGPEPEKGAPHILNVSFLGVRSEVLLHTWKTGRFMFLREAPAPVTSGQEVPL